MKAKVSTTWFPYVLIILITWPAFKGVAMPWRAGMVVRGMVELLSELGLRG